MSTPQPVTVHIQTGAGEVIRIVATLLLFGGLGMLVWAVGQGPMAEYASIAAGASLVFFCGRLWSRGVIGVPTATANAAAQAGRGDADAEFLRQVAQSASSVSGGYLRRCSIPILLLISVGYGVAFLLVREGVSAAMHVFQNLWIAGGVSLLLGSLVVMPSLFPSMFASLRRSGVIRPEGTAPATTPTPAAAAHTAATPAPAKVKVVRRVKKEGSDA